MGKHHCSRCGCSMHLLAARDTPQRVVDLYGTVSYFCNIDSDKPKA
jgi:hypothetical protein